MSDPLSNFLLYIHIYRHGDSEGNHEAKLTFSKGVGEGRGGGGALTKIKTNQEV